MLIWNVDNALHFVKLNWKPDVCRGPYKISDASE